jgi:hypothetical protein
LRRVADAAKSPALQKSKAAKIHEISDLPLRGIQASQRHQNDIYLPHPAPVSIRSSVVKLASSVERRLRIPGHVNEDSGDVNNGFRGSTLPRAQDIGQHQNLRNQGHQTN